MTFKKYENANWKLISCSVKKALKTYSKNFYFLESSLKNSKKTHIQIINWERSQIPMKTSEKISRRFDLYHAVCVIKVAHIVVNFVKFALITVVK